MMTKIRKVEKMEETCFDPFRVRLSFSLAEKLKMTIFGICLLPIRFISICLALNLGWALSCIGLVGLDINDRPVTGWRIQLQRVISALGRLCCTCFGFKVSKTGTQVITSHSKSLILPNIFGNILAPSFKLYRQNKGVGLGRRSPTFSHLSQMTASLISASFVFPLLHRCLNLRPRCSSLLPIRVFSMPSQSFTVGCPSLSIGRRTGRSP